MTDSPEERALAWQWLIEKRLTRLRENMPYQVFEEFAAAFDLILSPLEMVSKGQPQKESFANIPREIMAQHIEAINSIIGEK
jgi:hypothetical protein